jgi:hypothetical protein
MYRNKELRKHQYYIQPDWAGGESEQYMRLPKMKVAHRNCPIRGLCLALYGRIEVSKHWWCGFRLMLTGFSYAFRAGSIIAGAYAVMMHMGDESVKEP